MKTKIFRIFAAIIVTIVCWNPVHAKSDSSKPDRTERKSSRQITQYIRKETKNLKKEGFVAEIGAPGIEWQLRQSFEKQYMVDDGGNYQFLIGVGSAVSGIQNVARRHAATDAQIDACTQLESRILGLIETDYNNKLYSRNEYETLSRMKGVFSSLLAQTLPVGTPICTFYKDNGKFYDFQIRIAYPTSILKEKSTQAINEILGKENDTLRKKFERITGLDKLGSIDQGN